MPQRRPRDPVADDRTRCPWAERDLDVRYHDREWGVPARGERRLVEMRRAGFRFVGPTICYAFVQAVGMVNDHLVTSFRWREVRRLGGRGGKKGGAGC
jgi:3-methyladenine DNA glycosylase Tag